MTDPQLAAGDESAENVSGAPNLSEQEEREQQLQEDTGRRRVDVSLDVLTEDEHDLIETLGERALSDVEAMLNIDFNKSAAEQPEATEALQGHAAVLVTALKNNGFEFSSLGELPNPAKNIEIRSFFESPEALIALKVLLELARHTGSVYAKDFEPLWGALIDEIEQSLPVANRLKDNKEPEEDDDPFYVDAWNFIKEEPLKAAGLVAGGAVAGALVWQILKRFNPLEFLGKGKMGKGADILTFGTPLAAVLGTTAILGMTLGPKEWRQWVEANLGVSLTLPALWDFIKNSVKEGKLHWESFTEGFVKIDDVSSEVAQNLGISAEKVTVLSEMPLDEFLSRENELKMIAQDLAPDALKALGISIPEIPGFLSEADSDATVAAAGALIPILRSQEAQLILDGHNPETVGEALQILGEKGYWGEEGTEAARDARDDAEKQAEAAAEGDEQNEKYDEPDHFIKNGAAVENAREMLGKKSEVVNLLENLDEHSILEPKAFLLKLQEAANNDGHSLCTFGGTVGIITSTMEWLTISSCETWAEAAYDIFWEGNAKEGFVNWFSNTLGFVMVMAPTYMAANGILTALDLSKLHLTESGIRGARAGVVMPYTLAKGAGISGHFTWMKGQDLIVSVRQWRAKNPQAARLARLSRLEHLCRRFDQMNMLLDGSKRSVMSEHITDLDTKGAGKSFLANRAKGYLEVMREHYRAKIQYLARKMRASGDINFTHAIKGGELDPTEIQPIVDEVHEIFRREVGIENAENISPEEVWKARTDPKSPHGGPEGWERFTSKQVDEMLMQRGIKPGSREATKYMEAWDQAISKQLAEGKFDPFVALEVEGVIIRPRLQYDPASGRAIYRGLRVEIPADKAPTSEALKSFEAWEALRKQVGEQWTTQAAIVTEPELTYNRKAGKFEFKINGEPFEPLTGESMTELKTRYTEALEASGTKAPTGYAAAIVKHMSWIQGAEVILGTAGVAYMIYQIEFNPNLDRREVITEQVAILASAIAGIAVFEKTLGKRMTPTSPAMAWMHLFGVVVAGIFGVYLGEDKIEEILNIVLPEYPGMHAHSQELGEILWKQTGRKLVLRPLGQMAQRKATQTVLRKGVIEGAESLGKKAGTRQIERLVAKKGMQGVLRRSLGRIIARKTVQRIIIAAVGPKKAAAIIAGFADDALAPTGVYAPIALLTDVLAVGAIIWSAWDIYEIIKIYDYAQKLEEELPQRESTNIKDGSIRVTNKAARLSIMTRLGDLDADITNLNEENLFDFVSSEPMVEIAFQREGMDKGNIDEKDCDKEVWRFEDGIATYVAIYKAGELYAEIEGLDAEMLEQAAEEGADDEEEFERALAEEEDEPTGGDDDDPESQDPPKEAEIEYTPESNG